MLVLLALLLGPSEARGAGAVLSRTLRRSVQRQAAAFMLPKAGVRCVCCRVCARIGLTVTCHTQ